MTRAPAHRLLAGSFAALEPAFLEAVDELKRRDALGPVDVLTGSNLLAVYLRRRVAERRGAVANLRFLTFLDLARRLAPEADPRPQLPRLAAELLARRALRETPEAVAFEPLRERASLARLLLRTADDLRDAGIAPESLAEVLPAAAATPDRRAMLVALAAVIRRLESRRELFADPTSHLVRAAAAPRAGDDDGPPLLVYGPYDLGGLRAALLSRVAATRAVHAFVPEDGEDADLEDEPGAAPAPDLRVPLFERLLGVPAHRLPEPAAPPTRAVLAATDGDEARETVREVLRCARAGTPLHRIAVLLHDAPAREPALLAELRSLELPFFRPAGPGLAQTPAGRLAVLLVELAAEDFRRDDVREALDLLGTLGRLRALSLSELFPGELADVAQRLALTRGRAAWASRLARAHERLGLPPAPYMPSEDAGDGVVNAGVDAPRSARLEGRERLRRACDDLAVSFRTLASLVPESAGTWAGYSAHLTRSLGVLLGEETLELASLRPALEELSALSAVDEDSHSLPELREALRAALDSVPVEHGRFEADGLSVLSTVTARGLLFDVVLVPGLTERAFPAPGRPDPLLFDDERARVAALAGRSLPPRSGARHAREERFLFGLATRAARNEVVLLTARRDVVRDRQRLPSPFLREHLRRGVPLRETPLGASRRDPPPLDAEDVLRLHLSAAGRSASSLAEGLPALSRALARGKARRSRSFTAYEGALGRPTPLFDLLDQPLSPSRLERFASCPYRCFLETALRLPSREPAELPLVPDSRTLGELAHEALLAVTRELVARGGRFPEVTRGQLERLAREGVESWIRADDRELPAVFRERAEHELLTVLEGFRALERSRPAAARPQGGEVPFGGPRARAAPSLPAGGRAVHLRGRIDRVDREGGAVRVVDYKLGRPTPYGRENREGRLVAGGERLQLAVYSLAAAALFPGAEVSADYLFVERPRGRSDASRSRTAFPVARARDAVESLQRALELVAQAAAEGRLLPFTESVKAQSPCRLCALAEACGAGHVRVYERKWRGERERGGGTNPLLLLRELP